MQAKASRQIQEVASNAMDVDQFGPSGLMMAPSFSLARRSNQMVPLAEDNNHEMVRLIQQYLTRQGYGEVASQLSAASNVPMEEPFVANFRSRVLAGDFDNIPELVQTLVR